LRPVAIWHWLTYPPPTITEPEQRRRTHLLLTVLAVMWVMWVMWALYLLTVPLQLLAAAEATPARGMVTVLLGFHLAGAAPMTMSYLLARRGHYSASARILVPTASSIAFMEIMFPMDTLLINVPIVAIVLCSIFLSAWETVATYAITVVGYLVIAATAPSASSWDFVDPILLATAIGGIALATAVLRARDFQQIEAQAAELAAEQKQVLEERKMEAVARLSSGMAHEFNNILMAMSGNAQIIEQSAVGAVLESTMRIRDLTTRAARIVAGLLSLSEQQLLRPIVVDINTVMKEHEPALKASLRKTTTLLLQPAVDQTLLNIDIELFCRAIETLVRDLEEGISGPGTITIQTKKEDMAPNDGLFFPGGSCFAVTISNGISPKPDLIGSRMLETLQTTGNGAAANIDLAAANGIVRQSGGRIEIKADPELGATFLVAVPIYQGPAV